MLHGVSSPLNTTLVPGVLAGTGGSKTKGCVSNTRGPPCLHGTHLGSATPPWVQYIVVVRMIAVLAVAVCFPLLPDSAAAAADRTWHHDSAQSLIYI